VQVCAPFQQERRRKEEVGEGHHGSPAPGKLHDALGRPGGLNLPHLGGEPTNMETEG
jgi:hypothetical protein